MAIARKCDRCGAYYDEYKNTKDFNNGNAGVNGICFMYIDRRKRGEGTITDTHDLCPSCLEAVYQFVKPQKEDSQ